ncbi:hypothetical protein COM43_000245 [Wolbachia pipientis]|uniref:Uncharacterized protein n=1 Tax=Wolbachia pipientis TaxID=955 RepID=A0A6H2NV20_WOLPI|nr:hypothetical protein COM43_000245 [Wolbachia pipientis]
MSSQCLFLCHPSSLTLGSRKKNGVMQAPMMSFQCSFLVIPVLLSRHASSLFLLSSQCPDTGIQVAHKQTSIESGYNVFDEIIWKTGFQTGMTPSVMQITC